VYSKQEDGCYEDGFANAIQTNPSFKQREYRDSIISLRDSIAATVRTQRAVKEEEIALGIISNNINQIN